MASFGLTRRRLAAFAGVYGSVVLGVLASLVALRILGPVKGGRYTIVIGVVDFLATLVWLTSADALIKFGFRYAAAGDWGRFHRLIRLAFAGEIAAAFVATLLVIGLAPFASDIFKGGTGLELPLLISATLPPLQAVEAIARSGADSRRALRPARHVADRFDGAPSRRNRDRRSVRGHRSRARSRGRAGADDGLHPRHRPREPPQLPQAAPAPLGEDARPIARFVGQSAAYTGLISVRTWIAPLTLGIVRNAGAVGLFRAAQMPQTAFAALSSPLRMILLTEQTQDWEHGRREQVFAGIKRYAAGSAVFAAVALGPALWLLPWVVRILLGRQFLPRGPGRALHRRRGRDPARLQLDEDAPGHDRAPRPEADRPRRRDRGDAPADHRLRRGVGSDRRRCGRVRLVGRVRAHLGRDPALAPRAARRPHAQSNDAPSCAPARDRRARSRRSGRSSGTDPGGRRCSRRPSRASRGRAASRRSGPSRSRRTG